MNNYIKIFLIIMAGIFGFSQQSNATHIVGGDLTYRHIEGDWYEVDLTFRRDCFTGAPDAQFDNQAIVYIFDEEGNLIRPLGNDGKIIMNLNPDDTLNTFIQSDCGFEGEQVCVHETIYRERVRLPYNPGAGGYNLVYQRCCRNNTLANILDPDDTGGTWMTHLSEETLATNNNSPHFNQWPDVYICANEDVNFDFSANDADGDSLVYSLYTPLSGLSDAQPFPLQPPYPPYNAVEWKAPFGLNNMLGGANPLSIDPETGLLSGIPPTVGQFLVGVVVQEYRDGELIGFTRRDFQYNVRVCSTPPTADFVANDGECQGTTVDFENTTINATSFMWNFNYPSEDPQFQSTDENPTFTYDAPGIYQVELIAIRGTDSCRSEIIKDVPALFAEIDVDFDLIIETCMENGYSVKAIDRSVDIEAGQDIVNQEWTIIQNGEEVSFSGEEILFNIVKGSFDVHLTVESSSGCLASSQMTFHTDNFEHTSDFEYEITECADGNTVTLLLTDISNSINPFDQVISRNWSISTLAGIVTGDQETIELTVDKNETIEVLLDVDFGGDCMASINRSIDVSDFRPRASYSYEAAECPDEDRVTLVFTNTSTETNDLYTSASVQWTIINQANGQEFNSSANSFNYTIDKDVAISLEQIVTFENGCIDTLTETFIPGPYPTLMFTAEPLKICLGDTINYLLNANPDWTYSWDPLDDGIYLEDPDNTSSAMIIGIENTSYDITVTDGICTVTETLDVEVLDGDNLQVDGDRVVCDNTFSLSASGGIPPGQFEWATDISFDNIVMTGTDFSGELTGIKDTFYVRFTGETCGDDFLAVIVEQRVFDLEFSTFPLEVCQGDTNRLILNYNPDYEYTFTPNTGIVLMDGEPYIIGTEDQEYTVHITDGICEDTQTFSLDVLDIIDLSIVGSNYVCQGVNVMLSATELSEDAYEWSTSADFSNIISTDRELDVALEGDSITYYVRYTGNSCGLTEDSIRVKRYVFDLLYVESLDVCAGDTIVYNVFNQGELDLNYIWQPNEHIIAGDNTSSPTIVIGADETEPFTLRFVALTPDGCEYTDEIEFSIADRPIIDFDHTLTECGEYTVCFSAEEGYFGFPSWDFGDPTTSEDISIEREPCYTYPAPGVYTVELGNFSDVCAFESVQKIITINDGIMISDIDELQQACLGETINFSVSSSSNNVNFVWKSSDGDTLAVGNTFSGLVNENPYDVIVCAADPNGCESTKTITVAPFTYDIESNIPELFCEGQDFQVELLVNGLEDGFEYYWEPEEAIVSGGNTANPVINTTIDRTFEVTITDVVNGCESSQTFVVETVTFDISIDANPDAMINRGESITLYLEDPQSDYDYEWSTGETSDEIEVAPVDDQSYTVTVTDGNGCTATDEINVTVRQPLCDETDIFIPNAFSPNGDNTNDQFMVRSNFIDEIELIVYNRWGQEIFRTDDQAMGWDGTFKGEHLSPDVFAYYVSVICINQATYKKRGDISLLK